MWFYEFMMSELLIGARPCGIHLGDPMGTLQGKIKQDRRSKSG